MRANKRMYAGDVCESDFFMLLPPNTKCLYFYMMLNADDDGLLKNAETIRRTLNATKKDFERLEKAGLTISFPSGVRAIVHWWCHNNRDNVHHRDTLCIEEFEQLHYDSEKKIYTLKDKSP